MFDLVDRYEDILGLEDITVGYFISPRIILYIVVDIVLGVYIIVVLEEVQLENRFRSCWILFA